VRHTREHEATLITDAPESLDDEFDRRRKRYAIMMGLRALCVIAAAVTYSVSLLLALALIVGGAVLPWCAVILANDRPPRRARRFRRYAGGSGQRALPPGQDSRTVDGRPVDD
jgi:Flp pilus assembly protein TadB